MIGILQRKGSSTFGRCGCKVLRLINGIEIDDEWRFQSNGKQYKMPKNGFLTIDFEESDIVKETMTTLVIERCSVLENCEGLIENKSDVVHDMNVKHMQRFCTNYTESFEGILDLTKFRTLDVIDLRNIGVVRTNIDTIDEMPVFSIGDHGKSERVGEGLGDYFTEDQPYLYMAVPNSWHRIQRKNDKNGLVIDGTDLRSPKNDLLFVKYSKESLSSFLEHPPEIDKTIDSSLFESMG